MKNKRLLQTLNKQKTDRPPIWLLRQSGRYLPEYLKLRKQAPDFVSFCKQPELTYQAALLPLKRFNLDAAILFSDILTIADALKLGLHFPTGGPQLEKPLTSLRDIQSLPINCNDDLAYVFEGLHLLKQKLKDQLPVIGFSATPWTLAAYLIDHNSRQGFPKCRAWTAAQPSQITTLLEKLSNIMTYYCCEQIHQGADVITLFDTWGKLLDTPTYQNLVLPSLTSLINNIKSQHPNTPIIIYSQGNIEQLKLIKQTGCTAISIGWQTSLTEVWNAVGHDTILQGNMDPAVLLTNQHHVAQQTSKILLESKINKHFILNLGHGILPETPIENVKSMVDTVTHLTNPS